MINKAGKLYSLLSWQSSVFATLRLRERPGRDGCQSASWDAFLTWPQIRPPKQSHNALWQPSRPGLPRNLKVASTIDCNENTEYRKFLYCEPTLNFKLSEITLYIDFSNMATHGTKNCSDFFYLSNDLDVNHVWITFCFLLCNYERRTS